MYSIGNKILINVGFFLLPVCPLFHLSTLTELGLACTFLSCCSWCAQSLNVYIYMYYIYISMPGMAAYEIISFSLGEEVFFWTE